MSQGVLIADEQTILRTAENPAVGTLSERKVKSKLSVTTYKIVKRTCDIIVGLIGSILVLPLAVIVKISFVVTGDFGSIFFVQKRIGKDSREFNLYKFRSMVKNADVILAELIEKEPYKSEWAQKKKLKNDPRISKVGHLLRRSSLDEFPQFFNVLKGDMSVVGNRPYLPREKDEIPDRIYESLVSTKPGVTGYWQVSGRSNLDFSERIQLENFYSENASLGFDSVIFFKTFKSVLTRDGAD